MPAKGEEKVVGKGEQEEAGEQEEDEVEDGEEDDLEDDGHLEDEACLLRAIPESLHQQRRLLWIVDYLAHLEEYECVDMFPRIHELSEQCRDLPEFQNVERRLVVLGLIGIIEQEEHKRLIEFNNFFGTLPNYYDLDALQLERDFYELCLRSMQVSIRVLLEKQNEVEEARKLLSSWDDDDPYFRKEKIAVRDSIDAHEKRMESKSKKRKKLKKGEVSLQKDIRLFKTDSIRFLRRLQRTLMPPVLNVVQWRGLEGEDVSMLNANESVLVETGEGRPPVQPSSVIAKSGVHGAKASPITAAEMTKVSVESTKEIGSGGVRGAGPTPPAPPSTITGEEKESVPPTEYMLETGMLSGPDLFNTYTQKFGRTRKGWDSIVRRDHPDVVEFLNREKRMSLERRSSLTKTALTFPGDGGQADMKDEESILQELMESHEALRGVVENTGSKEQSKKGSKTTTVAAPITSTRTKDKSSANSTRKRATRSAASSSSSSAAAPSSKKRKVSGVTISPLPTPHANKVKKLRKVPKKTVITPKRATVTVHATGRRKRLPWSAQEERDLEKGVRKHREGNWKSIINDPALKFHDRSTVDIKDKWRNMKKKAEREAMAGQ